MGQPPTPPRKLSAAELFDTVEVDLWGHIYTLRTITRTVSGQLHDHQQKAQALDEDSPPDDLAYTLIDIIDLLLEPAEQDDGAGPLLRDLWEADTLGLDWITAFSESIQEQASARRRPTSASKTRG